MAEELTSETQVAEYVKEFSSSVTDVVIKNNDDYEAVTESVKEVKRRRKVIEDFFAPMKKRAHEAHKAIVEQEKQMLKPFDDAEAKMKDAMKTYTLALEAEKKAQEEAQRAEYEAEMEKLRQKIADCEAKGDTDGADEYRATLEAIEKMAVPVVVEGEKPTASGAYSVKTWEITNIDLSKVPCEIMGILIRPVDESAVKKLIRDSKGTVQIPGITYKESVTIGVRA